MIEAVLNEIYLDKACGEAVPAPDHAALLAAVRELLPDLPFRHALTRSGWHRIGGVVTADLDRVATNLRQWAEAASEHDMFSLYEDYADSGYLTTRFDGRTHYFRRPDRRTGAGFLPARGRTRSKSSTGRCSSTTKCPMTSRIFSTRRARSRPGRRRRCRRRYIYWTIAPTSTISLPIGDVGRIGPALHPLPGGTGPVERRRPGRLPRPAVLRLLRSATGSANTRSKATPVIVAAGGCGRGDDQRRCPVEFPAGL
ncbi:MAG: hypothetical protein R3D02_07330 [Hyphomicrobiales bacterium]